MNETIITALIVASSGIASALIANLAIAHNNKKHINWEREKLDRDYEKQLLDKKLDTYSEILKRDSDNLIVKDDLENNSHAYEKLFDAELYKKELRSLIYENFSLLDKEIKDNVREIDYILKVSLMKPNKKIDLIDHDELADLYLNMIDKICKVLECSNPLYEKPQD